jgi:hypothetical protein
VSEGLRLRRVRPGAVLIDLVPAGHQALDRHRGHPWHTPVRSPTALSISALLRGVKAAQPRVPAPVG